MNRNYINNHKAVDFINNPWPGLDSYEDPDVSDKQQLFYGRNKECDDVVQLIDDNIFVTIYGKSGTGKTSLINAGICPKLRERQYMPVKIRLGTESKGCSFQQTIINHIKQEILRKGKCETTNIVPLSNDDDSQKYLWSYFARTRFFDKVDNVIFPVIILDQFEEICKSRPNDIKILLQQIDFMMNENHAISDRIFEGVNYTYDYNFRFVIAIREDDLYRLEDIVDNCYLPDMKRNRYHIRPISKSQALEIIQNPIPGLYDDSVAQLILNKVTGGDKRELEIVILSLYLNKIYNKYGNHRKITEELIDKISDDIIDDFYIEAIRGISSSTIIFLEDSLITNENRRNNVSKSDLLIKGISEKELYILTEERKLLRQFTYNNDTRIEYIHDVLCPVVRKCIDKRKQARKTRILIIASSIITIIAFGIIAFLTLSNNNQRVSINQQVDTINMQKENIYGLEVDQEELKISDIVNSKNGVIDTTKVGVLTNNETVNENNNDTLSQKQPLHQQSNEEELKNKNDNYPDDIILGKWKNTKYKKLSIPKLKKYTIDDLRRMRGEILARYGYIFKDKDLDEYFHQQDWYVPNNELTLEDIPLNSIEKYNIRMITDVENRKILESQNNDINDCSPEDLIVARVKFEQKNAKTNLRSSPDFSPNSIREYVIDGTEILVRKQDFENRNNIKWIHVHAEDGTFRGFIYYTKVVWKRN